MNAIVPPKVYELLKESINEDLTNYSINVQDPNKKGEGYLGEMCYVSLRNRESGRLYDLIVKQAFSNEITRKYNPIRDVYLNEINFYTKVWPCLQEFQKKIPPEKAFNKIVKCLGTTTEESFEKLVLENIKQQNFETMDKTKTFDKEHFEYILKEYGKLHALSFAYRTLNPKGYTEISRGFIDIYLGFSQKEPFQNGVKLIHELCLESLHPGEDDDVIRKYKLHVENVIQAYADSNNYSGNYSVILHGDCWSNNMMFKYDEFGKLSDMGFLDFQLCKDGNPVSDLAYFIYSGGSKEIFDQLDHYLKVYHNSLLETVREFGVNVDDIYPFEVLKNDWKRHSQLGFTMALFLWRAKLTDQKDLVDFTDFKTDEDYLDTEKWYAGGYDEITFKKRTRDLILHLYENDFLVN